MVPTQGDSDAPELRLRRNLVAQQRVRQGSVGKETEG